MPNGTQSKRIRFERKQATEDEWMVWSHLKEVYPHNTSQVVLFAAVQLYKPYLLELQGRHEEAQAARRSAWMYVAPILGLSDIQRMMSTDEPVSPLGATSQPVSAPSPIQVTPTEFEEDTDF